MANIKYTREILEDVIKQSFSWGNVCRSLGVKPFTGAQTHIKKRAIKFGIDYSHFTGKLWSKGKKLPPVRHIEDYLTNRVSISSANLRIRLINEGIKEAKCESCNNTHWMGRPIPLELDHKDSNHWNNNLDNLQVVCANCHAVETAKRILDKKANI